jgi:hypothetical protein
VEVTNLVCDDQTNGKKHPGAAMATRHTFTLDGIGYEIDLCDNHGAEFESRLSLYTAAGRRVKGPGRARQGTSRSGAYRTPGERSRSVQIRAWGRANGHEVSDGGRLPFALVDAYEEAQK